MESSGRSNGRFLLRHSSNRSHDRPHRGEVYHLHSESEPNQKVSDEYRKLIERFKVEVWKQRGGMEAVGKVLDAVRDADIDPLYRGFLNDLAAAVRDLRNSTSSSRPSPPPAT